jgi:hypothetical protein
LTSDDFNPKTVSCSATVANEELLVVVKKFELILEIEKYRLLEMLAVRYSTALLGDKN